MGVPPVEFGHFSGREPRPVGYGVTGVTATGWWWMRLMRLAGGASTHRAYGSYRSYGSYVARNELVDSPST